MKTLLLLLLVILAVIVVEGRYRGGRHGGRRSSRGGVRSMGSRMHHQRREVRRGWRNGRREDWDKSEMRRGRKSRYRGGKRGGWRKSGERKSGGRKSGGRKNWRRECERITKYCDRLRVNKKNNSLDDQAEPQKVCGMINNTYITYNTSKCSMRKAEICHKMEIVHYGECGIEECDDNVCKLPAPGAEMENVCIVGSDENMTMCDFYKARCEAANDGDELPKKRDCENMNKEEKEKEEGEGEDKKKEGGDETETETEEKEKEGENEENSVEKELVIEEEPSVDDNDEDLP